MRRLTALALLFWFSLSTVVAEKLDLQALDAYCQKALDDWNVPGFSIVVVKDGETIFEKGYGVRTEGASDTVDQDTLFAIASNTKAFTSAGLAMLVEENKAGWSDRVRKHLPYFEVFQDPWISHETRLDDLLCHRVGFKTFSGDLLWWGTSYSPEEVVRRARFLKPQFGFRRGYGYSNIMFLAAGEVISAISGQSWSDFIRSRILQPTGMTNTALSVSELKSRSNVASPHGGKPNKPLPIEWQKWDNMLAAGGIISSASDMGKWLKLQLGQGTWDGKKYWSSEQAWKMWTVHNSLPITAKTRSDYPETSITGSGLGWFMSDYKGELIARHGGGYDGMFSHTVMAPKKKIGIVVLSNSMTDLPRVVAFYALDHFLGDHTRDWSSEALTKAKQAEEAKEKKEAENASKIIPNTQPSLPLEKYAGTYSGEMYGDAKVELKDGGLQLSLLPNPQLMAQLSHLQHDVFSIKWKHDFAFFGPGRVQFLLNNRSEVSELKMEVPNDDFWFDELEFLRK
ncbi:MAG: serine hydrolase [Verrucomicrobiales bacterium]